MRLSSLHHDLPEHFLEALNSLRIVSDVDLLLSSGSPLDIWRRLPPGLLSLQEFNNYVDVILSKASAPGLTADVLITLEALSDLNFGTGVPKLDALLSDFGANHVLEISGDTGSGKSALAVQFVCNHLSNYPKSSVLWIDTTGDFSPSRAAAVLKTCAGEATSTALDRLQIALAFDIESTYDILDGIRDGSHHPVRCLVIDAITPLLGPSLSAISAEGHAIMTTFVRQLRSIARTHCLLVLLINNSTSMPDGAVNPSSNFTSITRKPALGSTFTFVVDATLWLAKTDIVDANVEEVHAAELFKSRVSQSKRWCLFGIRNGLLIDVGAPPPVQF